VDKGGRHELSHAVEQRGSENGPLMDTTAFTRGSYAAATRLV